MLVLHAATISPLSFVSASSGDTEELNMSTATKFAQKKYAVAQPKTEAQAEAFEKVDWLFTADLDTMGLSISSKSGLVKVDVGAGRRNPFMYRNEILALLDKADEIRRYLDDHPQAKDVPPTKGAQREENLILARVNEARNKIVADLVNSMRQAGMADDLIALAVSKIK
jgi:hypothetical protein